MNYQTLLIYNLNGILVLLLKRWYIYFLGRLKILLYSWVRYITQQTITNIEINYEYKKKISIIRWQQDLSIKKAIVGGGLKIAGCETGRGDRGAIGVLSCGANPSRCGHRCVLRAGLAPWTALLMLPFALQCVPMIYTQSW